jgi:hypothetical protein
MALYGRLVVDNSPTLKLVVDGVGIFAAFSGDKAYMNRGGCTAIPERGPIPAGRYWIVARPTGGALTRIQTWAKDKLSAFVGPPTHHDEWFALYRDDGMIDDWTWIDGVKRGNFRLHPKTGAGISLGCITLLSIADFHRLRLALLHTPTMPAGNSGVRAYGWIDVVTIGNTCP